MSIKFYPRAGAILMADLSDFEEPEMNKVRPVIVVSPRLPYRSEIVTFVPISTTPPRHELPFVVRLSRNYNPLEALEIPTWAKCDMLLNLSMKRLNGFKMDRRRWELPTATADDLEAVRKGILCGLGFADLARGADQ